MALSPRGDDPPLPQRPASPRAAQPLAGSAGVAGVMAWDASAPRPAASSPRPPASARTDPICHQGAPPARGGDYGTTFLGSRRARSPQGCSAAESSLLSHEPPSARVREARLASEQQFSRLCADTERAKREQLQAFGRIVEKNDKNSSRSVASALAWA
mmetsp:Transcript_70666/g.184259  ORF Transcript_70666/g.184259 Transcript_70666/m.184259 type:complete len:158 (+) Transcript_70666:127-600(+)